MKKSASCTKGYNFFVFLGQVKTLSVSSSGCLWGVDLAMSLFCFPVEGCPVFHTDRFRPPGLHRVSVFVRVDPGFDSFVSTSDITSSFSVSLI